MNTVYAPATTLQTGHIVSLETEFADACHTKRR